MNIRKICVKSTPLPTMQQTHEDSGSLVQSLVRSVVGEVADLLADTHIAQVRDSCLRVAFTIVLSNVCY